MITKEKLIQVINKMPEKFSIEDVIEELVLLSKIEQGLNDVESGRVYTDSIVAEKMEKWLK
jgi:predicted transcriptional regulator